MLLWILVWFGFQSPAYAQGCKCPPGYEIGIGGKMCSKRVTANPFQVPNPTDVVLGDDDVALLHDGMFSFETTGNANWPFRTGSRNYPLYDSTGAGLPGVALSRSQTWIDEIRTNAIIRGTHAGHWYSKTFCLAIPENRPYVILAGGDNQWRVKLDGRDFAECNSTHCFSNGLFMSQELGVGNHFIEIKYKNHGGPGSLWFEVYQNTRDELIAAPTQLNRLFSTRSLIGQKWDYSSASSPDICPAGYTYDSCESKTCVKWLNAACELNLSVKESFCGQKQEVTFHNTTNGGVNVIYHLYKVGANGQRIQPALASSFANYGFGASWNGTLQELFPGQNFDAELINRGSDLNFEITADATSTVGSDKWNYVFKFTIQQIPTGITVTNNPPHPDPLPIDSNFLGPFSLFDQNIVDFRLKVLADQIPEPSSVQWALPQGNPPSGTGRSIRSSWSGPTPQGGVKLEAFSQWPNGCQSRAEVPLIISDSRGPSVPTAFTPNGDGLNDVFKPLGLNIDWKSFRVYNRWGQIVYEHTGGGQPKGWDGSIRRTSGGYTESRPQDPNVFVVQGEWRHMGEVNAPYRIYKGTVTLIR